MICDREAVDLLSVLANQPNIPKITYNALPVLETVDLMLSVVDATLSREFIIGLRSVFPNVDAPLLQGSMTAGSYVNMTVLAQ